MAKHSKAKWREKKQKQKKKAAKNELPPTTSAALSVAAEAEAYACVMNSRAADKYDSRDGKELVPSALSILSLDGVRVHDALVHLAATHSFAAPILLRTLLDILVSTIVLTKSGKPELAAFRYFLAGYRHMKNDPEYKKAGREDAKRMCRKRYEVLPAELKQDARRYLKGETDRAYWYQGEFGSPMDVLRDYEPKLVILYRRFSGAAHGGYFSLRDFREDPNDLFTGAQRPQGAADVAVGIASTLLLKQAQKRAIFQGVVDLEAYMKIKKKTEKALFEASKRRVELARVYWEEWRRQNPGS